MLTEHFPHLPEDGLTYTCRRDIAVSRDDVQFFTWEHPLIQGALDLILSEEHGNTNVSYIEAHDYKTGQFYLQGQFVVDCQVPKGLQVQRYLPSEGLHIALDPAGGMDFFEPDYPDFPVDLKKATAAGLIKRVEDDAKARIKLIKDKAEQELPSLIASSQNRMSRELDGEIQRLLSLQATNPNIRDSEIELLRKQKDVLKNAIESANYRLDSIRIVFCG